jgi:hypothetical protein
MESAAANYTHGGFIGVGPLTPNNSTNFITNLYNEKLIPENILTLWFNTAEAAQQS